MERQPANGPSVVAVVLAGGDRGDRLAADGGVAAKALVPIAGQPMGAYVLRALRGCPSVRQTIYVGPTDPGLEGLYELELPSGVRLVDSLALGLGAALAAGADSVLVLSADVPWIEGAMISRFLASCAASGPAAVYYPVVTQDAARARFPEHERTFVKLRDGSFTGANLALLSRQGATALMPLIDRLFRARKNPLALASLMGFDVFLSFLTGAITLARLERRAEALLGLPAKVVIAEDAELAADVDRASHLPGVLDPELPTADVDGNSPGPAAVPQATASDPGGAGEAAL